MVKKISETKKDKKTKLVKLDKEIRSYYEGIFVAIKDLNNLGIKFAEYDNKLNSFLNEFSLIMLKLLEIEKALELLRKQDE